jgi:ubiquinone/menaquinone biosynthesis C-methylase UbiE
MAMVETPEFRKFDRYKASSYHSYNFKMLSSYDTCIWLKLCQVALWDRTLVRALGPNIGSLRILDVGCATGRLLQRLAEAGATQLCGADLAPRILELARERLSDTEAAVELRAADAEDRLPWDRDSFDAVLLTGVLHHFFRPRDALAEVHRVLRPGGRLLVIDPCFFPPLRQLINLALRIAPHAGDFHFYSPKDTVDLLSTLGFEVEPARRVGSWAFLAVGLKP